jgi:hypothetical protein
MWYVCLIKHHATKEQGEIWVEHHAFFTSALEGGKRSASHHSSLTRTARAQVFIEYEVEGRPRTDVDTFHYQDYVFQSLNIQ